MKFNNLGQARGMALTFYTSVTKVLKLKLGKFKGLIPTFVEVRGGKTGRGVWVPCSWFGTGVG